jgi:aryl-alcohol dehydrogenase
MASVAAESRGTVAAVLHSRVEPFSVEQIALAPPGPREVLVAIAGTGLCHSDLVPRLPSLPVRLPLILGHEGAGVVEAVGRDVTDIVVGDHVVLSYDSCGTCPACRSGRPSSCSAFNPLNLTGWPRSGSAAVLSDGAPAGSRWFGQSSFAAHAIATDRNAVVVDRSLPLQLLGPLGCGIQTGAGAVMNVFGMRPGDSIAVFGVGAVGLAAVLAARVAGATTIVAVDLHPARLDQASAFGATHALDGAADALHRQIRSIVAGGVHFTFDTTGSNAVIRTAIASLAAGGTCGMVATPVGGVQLDGSVSLSGRCLRGIIEGDAVPQVFIPTLIELWRQGRFPFDEIITTYGLGDINAAEAAMASGEAIKPVLVPG